MLATWPTAGPALAFLKLLLSPANPALPGRHLLRILDPTDELVASQRSDIRPSIQCGGVRAERPKQICRKLVNHATGHLIAGHPTTVAGRTRGLDSI
jgi:hypothetical protein